ncbi:hypothetical protein TWF225_010164 [Orbilia oligospora]|uniref:Uncharacterized protein n=1 Tax=Orbilia oligospora TaxID=2813651 RepID=A0A7C8TRX7_ORBOL|nr:hypothetical protein TWF751_001441 [Orbilia oligospora]KAF3193409.1 hypothetical protein TWF225_010164 [Orbilia oligospora]KAF3240126.1 hypothetical protein TWF128_011386 [Orbilia oligospora]KAF3243359.1 hypothetical protein TWF217_011280 [Orbilia oligospora]KAF3296284.1 hypothetical protein TWF132_010885 [Orbilia oligospora]
MGIKGKRKQQRRQQQNQQIQLQETTADLEISSAESSTSASIPSSSSSTSTSTSTPEPEMSTIRSLLLCSIGNPGSLLTTRHSAAHILLPHLTTTPLSLSRPHGGPTASGPSGSTYTTQIFQSTSYMNVSGPAVSKAWKLFKSSPSNPNPTLIILHDELEKPVGKVKYKKDGSAGGHNGLSSIRDSLAGQKTTIHKIGLGIGRPESRDKNVVAEYVLGRMSSREKDLMIEEALPVVLQMIEDIGTGKLK